MAWEIDLSNPCQIHKTIAGDQLPTYPRTPNQPSPVLIIEKDWGFFTDHQADMSYGVMMEQSLWEVEGDDELENVVDHRRL